MVERTCGRRHERRPPPDQLGALPGELTRSPNRRRETSRQPQRCGDVVRTKGLQRFLVHTVDTSPDSDICSSCRLNLRAAEGAQDAHHQAVGWRTHDNRHVTHRVHPSMDAYFSSLKAHAGDLGHLGTLPRPRLRRRRICDRVCGATDGAVGHGSVVRRARRIDCHEHRPVLDRGEPWAQPGHGRDWIPSRARDQRQHLQGKRSCPPGQGRPHHGVSRCSRQDAIRRHWE